MRAVRRPIRTLMLLTGEIVQEVPAGVDRRTFMMRSAVVGAAAVISGLRAGRTEGGCAGSGGRSAAKPAGQVSADLDVVKKVEGAR